MLFWSLLFACGEKECPPTEANCPPCEEAAKATPEQAKESSKSDVTEAELELLKPYLEELRKGIHPFNEQGIGICKGSGRDCEEYLGTSADVIPEGVYMLRADLQAPSLSPEGKWKVDVEINCTITRMLKSGESTTDRNWNKSFTVMHSNRKEYGYRLSPLYKITSPSPYGKQDCTYKLIAHNANGDKEYTGKWTVPAKPKE